MGRRANDDALPGRCDSEAVVRPEMSIDEVDAVIRADASITHRFMKFLGAAVFSFRADIRSVRHGLALIGKEQIRQFVSLVALGGMGSDKSHELLVTAAVRGKFCELIGDDIMMPMSEVLEVLPLTDDMNLALQGKASPLRPALKFVECYERADWAACAELSRTHGIVETKVLDRYTEAVSWAAWMRG